ncbi:PadR family transcriptional regulator [Jonesia quinghaiensis]|uniref:PadR family transcriptional regulator n=1 Tax=Jonesia quinghaiensis TaxID=262806 RepID=UPI0003F8987C|nr:PadR family transcriptional regulator [Jonesia quinghaiensis]
MEEPTRPTEWTRATLVLCTLSSLQDGPTYGYDIAAHLARAQLGTVKGGTLYPLLNRLEAQGLVHAEWRAGSGGPGRKYYELTVAGLTELDRLRDAWRQHSSNVTDFVYRLPHTTQETSS